MLGTFGWILGSQGAFFLVFVRINLSIVLRMVFWVPAGFSKKGSAAQGLVPGTSVKTHQAKLYVGKKAQTRAGRKGEFFRGKVSQGQPHPLRHGVKV